MAQTFNVATGRPPEVALSPDGSRLYSAGSDGVLRVYSLKTGALIESWQIGTNLGGMDMSPDGSFLMVVERQPLAESDNQGQRVTTITVYKVDTATGQATSFPYQATGYDYTFFDAAVLSDGKVLLSQAFSGSGWVMLKVLDLDTGLYSVSDRVRGSSILSRSETGDRVLVAEPGITNAPLDIYQTGTGIVATAYANGVNRGIQALSPSGSLTASYLSNQGINVYNSALQLQTTLVNAPGGSWGVGRVTGLAFSPSEHALFVLDSIANTIVEIRTSDWSVVSSIPVEAVVGRSAQVGGVGSRLVMDPLARYFSVITDTGLVLVANPSAPAMMGTPGADLMQGTLFDDVVYGNDGADTIESGAGDDIIEGGAGDDIIDGGAGADGMTGGTGNDLYVVDNAGDTVTENGAEGTDEIRTSLASYSLEALPDVENLTGTSATGQNLRGNARDNLVTGGAGNDFLRLQDGGTDTAVGGAGHDVFLFGASLTTADKVDGGTGADQVVLQGDYSGGVTFGTDMVGLESMVLLPGDELGFGDPGGTYDYDITMVDENAAPGIRFSIDANRLRPDEDFTFDGSDEQDAYFYIYAGDGTDNLIGGEGDDVFLYGYFQGSDTNYNPLDTVDGRGGHDQMALRGNYDVTLAATAMTNVESLVFLSGRDVRANVDYTYNVATVDENVGEGTRLVVDGGQLRTGESMTFDGSAERDGYFLIFGGEGNDVITGGWGNDNIRARPGNDTLIGGLGADTLAGEAGNDTYKYNDVTESTATSRDTINGFTVGGDKIDLSAIDGDGAGPLNAFHYVGPAAFTGPGGPTSAGELRVYQDNGVWIVEGDTDGNGTADIVIGVITDGNQMPLATDFVL